MARKVGQIVRRGTRTWLVCIYNGRDAETKKRRYLNETIHGGLWDAGSSQQNARRTRSRSKSRLFEANTESGSRSMA
jgi:hypothetical protein